MKKEDSLKPYDPKKSVWVPDGEGGFDEAMITEVKGDNIEVKVGWEPKVFKADKVLQVTPHSVEGVRGLRKRQSATRLAIQHFF